MAARGHERSERERVVLHVAGEELEQPAHDRRQEPEREQRVDAPARGRTRAAAITTAPARTRRWPGPRAQERAPAAARRSRRAASRSPDRPGCRRPARSGPDPRSRSDHLRQADPILRRAAPAADRGDGRARGAFVDGRASPGPERRRGSARRLRARRAHPRRSRAGPEPAHARRRPRRRVPRRQQPAGHASSTSSGPLRRGDQRRRSDRHALDVTAARTAPPRTAAARGPARA